MDDWHYDFLKEDIKRLRDDLSDVERRTWKVENWQVLVPFRVWLAACWLMIAGMSIALIADAAGAF